MYQYVNSHTSELTVSHRPNPISPPALPSPISTQPLFRVPLAFNGHFDKKKKGLKGDGHCIPANFIFNLISDIFILYPESARIFHRGPIITEDIQRLLKTFERVLSNTNTGTQR